MGLNTSLHCCLNTDDAAASCVPFNRRSNMSQMCASVALLTCIASVMCRQDDRNPKREPGPIVTCALPWNRSQTQATAAKHVVIAARTWPS